MSFIPSSPPVPSSNIPSSSSSLVLSSDNPPLLLTPSTPVPSSAASARPPPSPRDPSSSSSSCRPSSSLSSSVPASAAGGGSVTITQEQLSREPVGRDAAARVVEVVLKATEERRVRWDEDNAVDNEMLGKSSSKCCCVYNRPHGFGETSDEDSGEDVTAELKTRKMLKAAKQQTRSAVPSCHGST
eukprot:GHVS01014160.1.p1 GENE.GHVS01014160.1~~GHVS01014160.1.p1  ORF type:complete len:186 (-),score=69.24 GHVS01014160.1:197-754(-)